MGLDQWRPWAGRADWTLLEASLRQSQTCESSWLRQVSGWAWMGYCQKLTALVGGPGWALPGWVAGWAGL